MSENTKDIWGRFQKEFELPFKDDNCIKDDNCANTGKRDKPQPNFRAAVKTKLDSYLEFFSENFDTYDLPEFSKMNLADCIKTSNKVILDTLDKHFEGKLLDAYMLLFPHLKSLFGQISTSEINYFDSKIWFRISGLTEEEMKNSQSYLDINRIFHVPFNERTKVSSYRYSIAGLPSLYLGENMHVCSNEVGLGIPVNPKFIGGAFRLKKNLKVIQFLRIEQFTGYKDFFCLNNIPNIICYLALFPFMIASSFQVCQLNHPFKPEYIIPQMLLSFVRKNDKIDGIMYPSTKIDYSGLKEEHPYNLVIPVKTNIETGYCEELRKYFDWTEPQLLSKISDNKIVEKFPEEIEKRMNIENQYFEGTSTAYKNTIYGKMEAQLIKDGIYTKKDDRNLRFGKSLKGID